MDEPRREPAISMTRWRVVGVVLALGSAAFLASWMIASLQGDAFWGETSIGFSLALLAVALLPFVAGAAGIWFGWRPGWPLAGVAGVLLLLVGLYGFAVYHAWEGAVAVGLGLALVVAAAARPRGHA